jgi:predicted kinase
MDLERLGAPELAARLVAAYEDASGARLPRSLLDFYVAYRAMVRCMVACVRADQEVGDAAEGAVRRARSLLALCHRRLVNAVPVLVLIGGLPGTGKSTVARGLGDAMGWDVVRSDVVRKERAGLRPEASAAATYGADLYESATTDAVYGVLAARAREQLGLGRSIVLDASFTAERHRVLIRAVATETRSRIVELRCVLDPEVAARRMIARASEGHDASDATPAIAREMAALADSWPEAVDVPTDGAPDDVTARVADIVRSALPGARPSSPTSAARNLGDG